MPQNIIFLRCIRCLAYKDEEYIKNRTHKAFQKDNRMQKCSKLGELVWWHSEENSAQKVKDRENEHAQHTSADSQVNLHTKGGRRERSERHTVHAVRVTRDTTPLNYNVFAP